MINNEKSANVIFAVIVIVISLTSFGYSSTFRLFFFPAKIVRFLAEDGRTTVEIYYGMPLKYIHFIMQNMKWKGEIEQKVKIYDSEDKLVSNFSDTRDVELSPYHDPQSSNVYVLGVEVDLEPGVYSVEIELKDTFTKNSGKLKRKFEVERFLSEDLTMSDIVLAYEADIKDMSKPLTRDNLKIFPHPAHVFDMRESVYIYYELYNLDLLPVEVQNKYKVEYSIKLIKAGPVRSYILNQLQENKESDNDPRQSSWISMLYQGGGLTDHQFMRIDYNFTDEGEYLLKLKVTDLVSGNVIQKSAPILVIDFDRR
jgi:hypothetical protein